jgi:hypothetical protein
MAPTIAMITNPPTPPPTTPAMVLPRVPRLKFLKMAPATLPPTAPVIRLINQLTNGAHRVRELAPRKFYEARWTGPVALQIPLYITSSLMVMVPNPVVLSMTYWKMEPLRLTANEIRVSEIVAGNE